MTFEGCWMDIVFEGVVPRVLVSGVAQLLQKRAVSLFSALHSGHFMFQIPYQSKTRFGSILSKRRKTLFGVGHFGQAGVGIFPEVEEFAIAIRGAGLVAFVLKHLP